MDVEETKRYHDRNGKQGGKLFLVNSNKVLVEAT